MVSCTPGYPQTGYVAKDELALLISNFYIPSAGMTVTSILALCEPRVYACQENTLSMEPQPNLNFYTLS